MKKSPITAVPLEAEEQEAFVQWLELNGLLFSATAQSTWTTSWNQKRKNYETGLRKGVPDLIVIIPAEKSADDKPYLLFIEMKRSDRSLSRLSKEQKLWVSSLQGIGGAVVAEVCYGADSAIETVSTFLKDPDNSIF